LGQKRFVMQKAFGMQVGDRDKMFDGFQLASDLFDKRLHCRIDRDQTGPRMVQNVLNFVGGYPEVYGDDDGSELGDRVVELEEPMAVEREGGPSIALHDPDVLEGRGEAIDPLIQLGERQTRRATDRGRLGRVGRRRSLESVRDAHTVSPPGSSSAFVAWLA